MTVVQKPEVTASRRIRAVDNALDVLDCMGQAGRPLGVSDIARRTKLTRATVTDLAALRRQLATVRTRGYAVCRKEREVGLCSIAVPLRNYTGLVVGSLALASPAARLTSTSLTSYLVPVPAAHEIKLHIGGTRPIMEA